MSQEPKVLKFAVDGKRRFPRLTGRPAERHAARRSARLRELGSLCAVTLVTAAFWLVHAEGPGSKALADPPQTASGKAPTKERAFHGALPQNVADMREQILAAVLAGDVAELKDAIAWNEIKPDFGEKANADPIAHWKSISADGQGREVLAILANLLALAPARLAIGKDPENTLVYVWPYLAELPLESLTPAEEVDLYRLMPPAGANTMRAGKKWTWWRIAIGADGTWHTFRKYD